MLNKKEKFEFLKKLIINKYFENGRFKDISLKNEAENNQYKLIKGIGEIIYGYDSNCMDYYFIFRDFKGEGFLWNRVSYKENGSYKTIDTVIPTDSFNKEYFKEKFSVFKLDNAKKIFHYRYQRYEELNQVKLDLDKILSLLNLNVFGQKNNKLNKFKTLGILLLSFHFNFQEEIFIKPSEEIERLLSERLKLDPFHQKSDLNYIFALYLIENINTVLNKNISIFYLLKEFKKLN